MNPFTLAAFADEACDMLDGQINALKENGIHYLEIRGVDGINIADLTPAQVKTTASKLSDSNIRVHAIGSPIGKVKLSDDFTAELDRLKRVLDTAHTLQATYIRMFSFYPAQGTNITDYRDEVLLRLSRFVEAARGSGTILAHENEASIYGEQLAENIDIMHAFNGEIKAVLDPGNYVLAGVDPLDAYAALKDNIAYMHIKDGKNGAVVPPGEGIGRIREVLAAKMADSGGCILTLEPHLSNFIGLSAQHQGADVSHFQNNRFADNREAFDFAVSSLRKLLP